MLMLVFVFLMFESELSDGDCCRKLGCIGDEDFGESVYKMFEIVCGGD